MKIKIHENAAKNYLTRVYRHARPDCPMLHRPEWYEMLKKVEGTWLDVETKHLFSDQFNTAPIPGVSENGMRIMQADVVEIQDDERIGVSKCSWCFGDDRNGKGKCGKCGKTDTLRPLLP